MPVKPDTKYTRLGTQRIAYQVMGTGPIDVVWTAGRIGSMEGEWADPEAAVMLRRIPSFCRMIRYDSEGSRRRLAAVRPDRLTPFSSRSCVEPPLHAHPVQEQNG